MSNNQTAIEIEEGEQAEITGNTIANNPIAIKIKANNASIKNNNINNNPEAIIVQDNSKLFLSQNNISFNNVGLLLDTASAEIESNIFESSGNNNGILIYSDNSVSNTLINNNNFLYFEERAIVAMEDENEIEKTNSELNATQNYWGTTVNTEIEELLKGKIDFEPYAENEINLDN